MSLVIENSDSTASDEALTVAVKCFLYQGCADPEIFGPCQSADSDQRMAKICVQIKKS